MPTKKEKFVKQYEQRITKDFICAKFFIRYCNFDKGDGEFIWVNDKPLLLRRQKKVRGTGYRTFRIPAKDVWFKNEGEFVVTNTRTRKRVTIPSDVIKHFIEMKEILSPDESVMVTKSVEETSKENDSNDCFVCKVMKRIGGF